jgi:hypothetical protein
MITIVGVVPLGQRLHWSALTEGLIKPIDVKTDVCGGCLMVDRRQTQAFALRRCDDFPRGLSHGAYVVQPSNWLTESMGGSAPSNPHRRVNFACVEQTIECAGEGVCGMSCHMVKS